MTATQAPAARGRLIFRVVRTVVLLAVCTSAFTWLIRASTASLQRNDRPAGFADGVLHGICMPATLPHLLLGSDVPIFAGHNNGRLYKLGYTVGTNGCGMVFFGLFYWRFRRLARRLKGDSSAGTAPSA